MHSLQWFVLQEELGWMGWADMGWADMAFYEAGAWDGILAP